MPTSTITGGRPRPAAAARRCAASAWTPCGPGRAPCRGGELNRRRGEGARAGDEVSSCWVSSRKTSSRLWVPKASHSGADVVSSHHCDTLDRVEALAGSVTIRLRVRRGGRPRWTEPSAALSDSGAGLGRARVNHQPGSSTSTRCGSARRASWMRDQPAVVDDVDPVGQPLRSVHVDRGQTTVTPSVRKPRRTGSLRLVRRVAGCSPAVARRRRTTWGWLDQRDGQAEPLLLPAREPAGCRSALRWHSGRGRAAPRARAGRPGGRAGPRCAGASPAPGGRSAPRATLLQHHADPG